MLTARTRVSLLGQDVVKSESLWGMGVGSGVERGCRFSVPWGSHCYDRIVEIPSGH